MEIGARDRKALQIAAAAIVIFLLFRFAVFPLWDSWQAKRAQLPVMETKLIKYRQAVAGVDQTRSVASALRTKLRESEAGLLQSTTAALASAELQDLVKQMMAARAMEVRASEFLPVKSQSADYVQVPLGVQFTCRLDQLTSLLQEVSSGPKILTVPRLVITTTNQGQSGMQNDKTLNVNMTVAGLMRATAERSNSEVAR